jgi:hypothetical protein
MPIGATPGCQAQCIRMGRDLSANVSCLRLFHYKNIRAGIDGAESAP